MIKNKLKELLEWADKQSALIMIALAISMGALAVGIVFGILGIIKAIFHVSMIGALFKFFISAVILFVVFLIGVGIWTGIGKLVGADGYDYY